MKPTFDAPIDLRADPEPQGPDRRRRGREMTTVAEFLRRELRGIFKAGLAHGDNGGPAPFRPSPGQRIAA